MGHVAIRRCLDEIGRALRLTDRKLPMLIVIVATLRPEDCELAREVLERSTERATNKWVLCTSPIFVRQGSILEDLAAPPLILTGTADGRENEASHLWSELMRALVPAETREAIAGRCLLMEEAAMVKLSSNAFHALKVCFANEIGRLCRNQGIDSQRVMDAFCTDRVLNLSAAYLRPGFAYGGSCLGKDTEGLLGACATTEAGGLELLRSLRTANSAHIMEAVRKIRHCVRSRGVKRIGLYGLTFKDGTDDLRDSSILLLLELLPRDLEVHAFDRDLERTPELTGKNLEVWRKKLEELNITNARSAAEVATNCRVLVIAKKHAVELAVLESIVERRHVVIDLVCMLPSTHHLSCEVDRIV